MSNTFFETSKHVSNNYIQSIVFLDDRAYKGPDKQSLNHDFDPLKITQAFAKENKICAVYNPETYSDIQNFKLIANKSDVVILDWQIAIQPNIEEEIEEEEDAIDDPRGIYTLEILKCILEETSKNKEGLKLIIIYTGETNLNDITEKIFEALTFIKTGLRKDNCQVVSNNVKVLVRGKSNVEENETDNKFSHLNELNDKIIKYKDLPNFILDEFTKMTSGLLSNFALIALTTLRNNSSKILGLFSKELDNAYLSHKSLLPNQEDAEDLLIELFGDTIADLLFYNKSNEEIRNILHDWINENIKEENKELFKKDGRIYNPKESFKRTPKMLIELLESENKDVEKRYVEIINSNAGVTRSKLEDYFKYISLNNTLLFLNESEESKKSEIDQKFSILTHHKSLFIPDTSVPRLTLGTIVRSTVNQEKYYICIQQKCDSVRIFKDVERKFLFIPLIISDNKFDILTPAGIKLKKVKDSFSIRTIKFVCKDDKGVIKAERNEDGVFIFKQKYEDEHFEWILDLKDLHSQRIIIEYTSQLSRVGLDESEWHRRWSGN